MCVCVCVCVVQSLKGDARVALASSAGGIGGGSFELRAPFGSVSLAQSRKPHRTLIWFIDGIKATSIMTQYISMNNAENIYEHCKSFMFLTLRMVLICSFE